MTNSWVGVAEKKLENVSINSIIPETLIEICLMHTTILETEVSNLQEDSGTDILESNLRVIDFCFVYSQLLVLMEEGFKNQNNRKANERTEPTIGSTVIS